MDRLVPGLLRRWQPLRGCSDMVCGARDRPGGHGLEDDFKLCALGWDPSLHRSGDLNYLHGGIETPAVDALGARTSDRASRISLVLLSMWDSAHGDSGALLVSKLSTGSPGSQGPLSLLQIREFHDRHFRMTARKMALVVVKTLAGVTTRAQRPGVHHHFHCNFSGRRDPGCNGDP